METDVDFSIDAITPSGTSGWAWLPDEPDLPLSIEIVTEDGTTVSRSVADEFRKDLANAHKREGWCAFTLSFDPDIPEGPLRIQARSGIRTFVLGPLFQHSHSQDNAPCIPPPREPAIGHCDGIRGRYISGWAWRPTSPDDGVDVDLYIDGILFASAEAKDYRADLRIAGIGHGRYGWRIVFPSVRDRRTVNVVVRERGGSPIQNGVFQHPKLPSQADLDDPEIKAFVEAALGDRSSTTSGPIKTSGRKTHFFVHAHDPVSDHMPGYLDLGYTPALEAFIPVLEMVGQVHRVADPLDSRHDLVVDEAMRRGEASLLLSFAPPDSTPLGLFCPVVPMMAWQFPTLPEPQFGSEPHHDWHFVLRQAGRAIASSQHAANAIRTALGADYPVAVIPAPIWNRVSQGAGKMPMPRDAEISIEGFILDVRGFKTKDFTDLPPLPSPSGPAALDKQTTLTGTIFTAIIFPQKDRQDWIDILVAFLAAFSSQKDATLIFKINAIATELWWWDFHETILRQPDFSCRVVVLYGSLDAAHYNILTAASHWIVNLSTGEAQSLPLQQFMSAGRPAIAPVHTAMGDYINASNALIVDASEDYGTMSADHTDMLTTIRYRMHWTSLRDAFSAAYRETVTDPAAYAARCDAARETMRLYCSDEVVAAKLDSFLGLGLHLGAKVSSSSPLLAEVSGA